ncbi:MAG TPA: cell division protein FtsA, partial [Longimicrobiaceae bacterium]|nr:cell division protein FtsA [Longimicrobiaceae bacterium]
PVRLPADLRTLDHAVLPGLGERHPWVDPVHDWLTDSLLLLSEPLEPESVKGLKGYRTQRQGDARFGEARLALPLRAEFFRWFSPDDVDRMLAVDVLPSGSVTVSLTLDVGPEDGGERVVVRRTYDEGHVRREAGPGLAIWPSFQHDRWKDYVLFRTDSTTLLAENMTVEAFAGGRQIAAERVRRTPLVEAVALSTAPEVLEIRSTVAGPGRVEPLGVVLPRFVGTDSATQTRWEVGVDFGTSNTVISIRENEQPAARLFGSEDLMLPLTHTGPGTADLMSAYFFPASIPERPFGTAVVHMKNLPRLDVEAEKLGLRVTVPFSGYVDSYETNKVAGDLKWSRQSHSYFLSASFLRHVVATVLGEAVQHGVDPAHVTFRWAYPRAFSTSQVNQLRKQWQHVMATFAHLGLAEGALREELDESTSALRHFFNAGQVGVAGDMQAILDIGGGTSDLAVYGRNKVLVLDSVILGGRNLTGRRQQAASQEMLGNPFVDAFFRWACEHDLPQQARGVVETYLRDGEVHLAFSYLVGTAWFQQGRAALFHADAAFHGFQGIIFYFFGALFYYVGLTFRALAPEGAPVELPQRVVLAGNGSRYIDWLTDLVPSHGPDVFKRALAALAVAGAGPGAVASRPPHVERSDKPKEEVARGLVALVQTSQLSDTGAALTPVIGERLVTGNGAGDAERRLDVTSRFDAGEVVDQAWAAGMRWEDGEMEIERFHAALLGAVGGVGSYGEQWARTGARYRSFFQTLDRRDLQEETRRRLEYQTGLESGFRGSIFLLEATAVLDLMRDAFFRR